MKIDQNSHKFDVFLLKSVTAQVSLNPDKSRFPYIDGN